MRCISSPAQQFPSLSPVAPYTAAVPLSPDHILSSPHLLGTKGRTLSPCSAGKSSSSQAAINTQLLDRLHLHSCAAYVLYRLVKISQFGGASHTVFPLTTKYFVRFLNGLVAYALYPKPICSTSHFKSNAFKLLRSADMEAAAS